MPRKCGSKAHSVCLAFLAKRGALFSAQDREWCASLPAGRRFVGREAAAIWGLARRTAARRLNLLRDSGLVQWSRERQSWAVVRRAA